MNGSTSELFVLAFSVVLPLMSKAFALSIPIRDAIDLQRQHHHQTPIEKLKSIEEACKTLEIENLDVYGDFTEDSSSSYLRKFEAEVASDFGKEDAVFMPSGTMAQNIALLIHSQKELHQNSEHDMDLRFACHHSSHLLLWEEDSYSKLGGFRAVEIDTRSSSCDGIHIPAMTKDDVESVFLQEKGRYHDGVSLGETGLSTLIIELPHRELGGKLTPWDDVVSIGDLCKEHGIKYHCDGARIFEASAGYGKTLSELAQPFDSVYISFYKGLGAMTGAMLMGDKDFCEQARVWLTRFGGNLYTKMPYAASCWMGYRFHASSSSSSGQVEDCPAARGPVAMMSFSDKFEKLKRITARIRSDPIFLQVVGEFTPIVPETNMVHVYLKESLDLCEGARDQVCSDVGINVFRRIREIPRCDARYAAGYKCYLEWTMGDANGSIVDEDFVKAWKLFSFHVSELKKRNCNV